MNKFGGNVEHCLLANFAAEEEVSYRRAIYFTAVLMRSKKIRSKKIEDIFWKMCEYGWIKRLYFECNPQNDVYNITYKGSQKFRSLAIAAGEDATWYNYFSVEKKRIDVSGRIKFV